MARSHHRRALPGVILLLILLPMGMLLTALVWNYLPERGRTWLPEGLARHSAYPRAAVHRLGRLSPEPHHRERLHAR